MFKQFLVVELNIFCAFLMHIAIAMVQLVVLSGLAAGAKHFMAWTLQSCSLALCTEAPFWLADAVVSLAILTWLIQILYVCGWVYRSTGIYWPKFSDN
jgi:hypothetical protein